VIPAPALRHGGEAARPADAWRPITLVAATTTDGAATFSCTTWASRSIRGKPSSTCGTPRLRGARRWPDRAALERPGDARVTRHAATIGRSGCCIPTWASGSPISSPASSRTTHATGRAGPGGAGPGAVRGAAARATAGPGAGDSRTHSSSGAGAAAEWSRLSESGSLSGRWRYAIVTRDNVELKTFSVIRREKDVAKRRFNVTPFRDVVPRRPSRDVLSEWDDFDVLQLLSKNRAPPCENAARRRDDEAVGGAIAGAAPSPCRVRSSATPFAVSSALSTSVTAGPSTRPSSGFIRDNGCSPTQDIHRGALERREIFRAISSVAAWSNHPSRPAARTAGRPAHTAVVGPQPFDRALVGALAMVPASDHADFPRPRALHRRARGPARSRRPTAPASALAEKSSA